MGKFRKIDLTNFYNNNGFNNKNGYLADFTCKGLMGRYPQEEVPEVDNDIIIENVPFIFPSHKIEFNNMELQNQKIQLHPSKYKKIHFLCAADTGSFEEKINIVDINNNNIIKTFRVTDWMAPEPYFNDRLAFRFSKSYSNRGIEWNFKPAIWYQVISLEDYNEAFRLLEFRDNPSVHIFSLTLEVGGDNCENIY